MLVFVITEDVIKTITKL